MEEQNKEVEQPQGGELQKVEEKQEVARTEAQLKMEFRSQLEAFTKLLNYAPNPKKIAKHKQGYLYLPVSVVEKDLFKMFFGMVQYEVLKSEQIFNEILVTARIKVLHPVLNQWLNYDGVGSSVIQQDANTKVMDFHQFKKPNAMQLAFPKAYAEAIKNAAKKIGKRFGADINRDIEDNYEGFIKAQKEEKKEEETVN